MKYISHPLIKPDSLEERRYQLSIAVHAMEGNTMVVLPTGLGKTAVALLATASRLRTAGGKMLMMAPTKPLVDQHRRMFTDLLIEPENPGDNFSGFAFFTGETKTSQRKEMWEKSRVILATPQVIKNDIIAGRYSLKDVTLLIVDECHRAVGNYAYAFIAESYMQTGKNPLILAMTASPGSKEEKVHEVCENLSIKIVESRTEDDPDVRPYIHEREVEYVNVGLPEELEESVGVLKSILEKRLNTLFDMGYTVPRPDKLSMKELNGINAQVQRNIQKREPDAFLAASIHAEIMKIRHAITLGESQGSTILKGYLNKLAGEAFSPSGSKAGKRLAADHSFQDLLAQSDGWKEEVHPKPDKVAEIVRAQLDEFPDSRILVFANFRDTVNLLSERLNKEGFECARFIGQASRDSEKGLSQKKQIETLSKFREGEFRVLVATSVGEEGLDVPSTDLVIFYEAVPSEIRSIQRKGRTGRHGSGKIVVLITKGTTDEAFSYISGSREKSMKKGISLLKDNIGRKPEIQGSLLNFGGEGSTGEAETPGDQMTDSEAVHAEGQTSFENFPLTTAGPAIIADDRETSSAVVENLYKKGAALTIERLEYGDYKIGDKILIERKTARDFVDTLVERDLIGQIRRMSEEVAKPVLIIEGEDLYSQRNINPNAIRGALSAITIGMGVSEFRTENSSDTAEMLYVMASREAGGSTSLRSAHQQKAYRSKRENQEYIISSFPGVGLKNARALLEKFGTIQNILNADEDELESVPGIGRKIAESILDISKNRY